MHLSTRQLAAFVEVARTLSFTKAARRLNVTQSALSQRIRKLEEELGAALLIRSHNGVRLTDTGWRILRFCEARKILEEEIVADLSSDKPGELAGLIRIAADSCILRPVLIPVLAPLLRANPLVQCELIIAEGRDLPQVLKRGEADFVIMDRCLDWSALTTTSLGKQVYLAIESAQYPTRKEIYLDLEPDDRITELFFQHQTRPVPAYRRSYLSDVFGIIDGVVNGLGRAVVARHLIRNVSGLRILRRYRPWTVTVTAHYYTQPYYTRLHQAVLEILKQDFGKVLQQK